MLKKIKKCVQGWLIVPTLWCLCFQLSTAHAALSLELTQGVRQTLPVALLPFSGSQVTVPGSDAFWEVISHDLQNSGQFGVTVASQESPVDNNDYWRSQKINDVIFGSIDSMAGNRYRVVVNVNDVYTQKALIHKVFEVDASQLRSLAHHVSDVVYQSLTGVRGIFSTRLAYVLVQQAAGMPKKYSLVVADEDGFAPHTLLVSPQPIMSPTWSPDGRSIAYVSFEHSRAAVFEQDIATGKRRLLSGFPGINGAPAFSPDGSELALVLTRTGNPKIYLLNIVKNQVRQLTKGWSIDTEPAFSPDGHALLFTSNRGGKPQIYQIDLNNQQVKRLTYAGDYNARASYFPNGKAIVMMHRQEGLFGIASENLANGRVRILTHTGADESPSLAPNGKMVLYATQYGGRGVLAMVSTDGAIKLRLPSQVGTVREPAWSPFLQT